MRAESLAPRSTMPGSPPSAGSTEFKSCGPQTGTSTVFPAFRSEIRSLADLPSSTIHAKKPKRGECAGAIAALQSALTGANTFDSHATSRLVGRDLKNVHEDVRIQSRALFRGDLEQLFVRCPAR